MTTAISTNKTATNKTATNKTATNKAPIVAERISDTEFRSFLTKMRNAGKNSEKAVQNVFLAVWRDVACSHSLVRLNQAYEALAENPFRMQFSAAIRALAGAGEKDAKADTLKRTGYNPLAYNAKEKCYLWAYDKREANGVKDAIAQNYKDFPAPHFRAIKLAKSKNVFTWAEVDSFRKRIENAKKAGNLYEKDTKRLDDLIAEIERLTNGK